MIGVELPARTVDEALRVIRALGSHRYIAGKQLLVHAIVLSQLSDDSEACAWANAALTDRDIDPASRDERLTRACSPSELERVLHLYWSDGADSERARNELRETLARLELPLSDAEPFDERREDDLHPLLIDAGWELLQLAELDHDKHKGAIGAFGESLGFEVARFEEQESMPRHTHLYELGAIGARELLDATLAGELQQPLVLYIQGNETYVDYLVRGVLRAAKLG